MKEGYSIGPHVRRYREVVHAIQHPAELQEELVDLQRVLSREMHKKEDLPEDEWDYEYCDLFYEYRELQAEVDDAERALENIREVKDGAASFLESYDEKTELAG